MCSSYKYKKIKMPINTRFTQYREVICNAKYYCKVKSSVSLHSLQFIIRLLMTCLWFSVTEAAFSLWMGNEQLSQDQPHHSRF